MPDAGAGSEITATATPSSESPPLAPAATRLHDAPPTRRLSAMRRTPCIGICSTTYGDLVCRGCKRFAHEIVGWNSYDDRQRELVWQRLHRLLAQSVQASLRIVDQERLRGAAREAAVPDAATLPLAVLAFQTMRRRPLPLAMLGLAPHETVSQRPELDTRDALLAIDQEFHRRSRAHYEAAFKTPAL